MSGPKLTDEEAQCSAAPNDEQQEKKKKGKSIIKKSQPSPQTRCRFPRNCHAIQRHAEQLRPNCHSDALQISNLNIAQQSGAFVCVFTPRFYRRQSTEESSFPLLDLSLSVIWKPRWMLGSKPETRGIMGRSGVLLFLITFVTEFLSHTAGEPRVTARWTSVLSLRVHWFSPLSTRPGCHSLGMS